MVEKRTRKTPSKTAKTRDPRAAARFIEELSWLLQSYSNLDFRVLEQDVTFGAKTGDSSTAPKNQNIHYLVGTLPIIFNNPKYFPNNEDIVEFANMALRLNIARWEKRSRYELIGLIVCETARIDDQGLGKLVEALTRVTAEEPGTEAIIASRKENSMNWNDLIQLLTSQSGT